MVAEVKPVNNMRDKVFCFTQATDHKFIMLQIQM
jgi:hypothetical protein